MTKSMNLWCLITTDDTDALVLLQIFYKDGCGIDINGHPDHGFDVAIKEYGGEKIAMACCPTLAEALCKASLLASNGF